MIQMFEDEFYDMSNDVDITGYSESSMCLYGVNVNLERAIPLVADGLKPVWRKILFTLYKNYNNKHVKVESLIGDVLKLHPHSNMGMKDIIARLCQPFSNNVPLLVADGNCGNATVGKDAAAGRYWSCKLSQFTKDVLFDEFDGAVNMKPSYDDTQMEPISLPAKFPTILLNGTCGIGYTLSSNVYPYNLNEIADVTIKLLNNPSTKIKLVPDSPTGCDIIIKDDETFIMQSTFDLDNVNYRIIIKNTPYQKYLVNLDDTLRSIQDSDNPIKEIISARDNSDLIKGKVEYIIQCKPCNLYNIINTLFKRVPGFRDTISTRNMIVVDNFSTKKYSIRQIILAWIQYRLKYKTDWYLRRMVKINEETNMLTGKAFMLAPKNLEKTIKIFRSCKTVQETIEALVKEFKGNVTTSQAHYMADVKLRNLTIEEYDKTMEKINELNKELEEIRKLVEDPEKIKNKIIDEIKEIKAKYGTPRKSHIINLNSDNNINIGVVQILPDGNVVFSATENPEHLSSDITPISGDTVCLIDDKGRFYWVNTNSVDHDTQYTLTSLGKEKMSNCVCGVSNRDNDIVILTNKGRIKYMPINKIPSNQSRKPIIPIDDDEHIVSIIESCDSNSDILIYTTQGMGKRIQVSDLNKVMSVDAQGQFIFKTDYEVAGMFVINQKKPLLCYITRLGRIRVNHSKFLVNGKKFGEPKPIIKLTQQDDLINVFCCDKDQIIVLNHADGRVSSVNINSIDVTTMAIEPTRPKHVPAVKVIRASIA